LKLQEVESSQAVENWRLFRPKYEKVTKLQFERIYDIVDFSILEDASSTVFEIVIEASQFTLFISHQRDLILGFIGELGGLIFLIYIICRVVGVQFAYRSIPEKMARDLYL
jgi:hypothetical protein